MAQTPDESMADNTRWLMDEWTAALVAAIESMTEERPEIRWIPADDSAVGGAVEGEPLCWEQGFRGIPQASLWVAAPERTWSELGRRTLRAAGIEAAEGADARNTYLEILTQSLSGVAQSLGARLGKELVCERGGERKQADPSANRFAVALSYPDLELGFEVSLSLSLMAAVKGGPEGMAEPAENVVLATSQAPASGELPRNMDLLLDVELPVSVSFGRTELAIKEVLKLTTGSIVELNRSLNEPVEVVVNNCVVARGEVVVIEGNYGVRIQHIVSRQERLRSLK